MLATHTLQRWQSDVEEDGLCPPSVTHVQKPCKGFVSWLRT